MKIFSKRKMSLLLGSGCLLIGAACAHFDDRLKADLDPWIGQHPDRLVELWGAPSSSYAMSTGSKVMSYFNDRTYSRSSGMGYANWRWGSYSYTESCKINFFTDAAQKKIERYTTTGDVGSCVETLRDLPRVSGGSNPASSSSTSSSSKE